MIKNEFGFTGSKLKKISRVIRSWEKVGLVTREEADIMIQHGGFLKDGKTVVYFDPTDGSWNTPIDLSGLSEKTYRTLRVMLGRGSADDHAMELNDMGLLKAERVTKNGEKGHMITMNPNMTHEVLSKAEEFLEKRNAQIDRELRKIGLSLETFEKLAEVYSK